MFSNSVACVDDWLAAVLRSFLWFPKTQNDDKIVRQGLLANLVVSTGQHLLETRNTVSRLRSNKLKTGRLRNRQTDKERKGEQKNNAGRFFSVVFSWKRRVPIIGYTGYVLKKIVISKFISSFIGHKTHLSWTKVAKTNNKETTRNHRACIKRSP